MRKQREINIDFIKIMACFGVVALHTINGSLGVVNMIITLLATMCIPLFFMVNGYLMFKKDDITYSYVFHRIGKIITVCFAWEFLHAVAYFLYYRKWRNFLLSFILDFIQEGLFFHFWFMGALIIINLLLPSLRKLEKKNLQKYALLTLFLGFIGVGMEFVSLILKEQIQLNIIQTFRLWTWLFYFMVGGLISVKYDLIVRDMRSGINKKIILLWGLGVVLSIIWQWEIGNKIFGGIMIEEFYSSFFIVVAVIMTFILMIQIRFPLSSHHIISRISSTIMGIYIVHPFVLAVIKKFVPNVEKYAYINILYWIVTVIISCSMTWIINKIPVLKELIKI